MREKTLKILEFDKILDMASGFCHAELSKTHMKELRPAENFNAIKSLLNEVDEAYLVLNKYILKPLTAFDDCREALKKSAIGVTLSIPELLKTARLLKAARIAKNTIAESGEDIIVLKNITLSIFVDIKLENDIFNSILDENTLSDNASPELREIRKKIQRQKSALSDKLSSYTKGNNEVGKYLRDNFVTVRNGRYVLPVKSEYRSAVSGLMHDQSASGNTVFIEPFAIVELNNALKTLEVEENIEIERILAEFTAKIAEYETEMIRNLDVLIRLDIIFAKAEFSVSIKATQPIMNEQGVIKLIQARHPLIDKNRIVPVDISLGENNSILIISGANTGGKTVCMKTVGLLCAMAYCGFGIPCAEGSRIPFFDDIFCDIGDNQSIADSLSTFSARIINFKEITENLTNKSLILLDEPGSGTDPEEGVALAIGIIEYIRLMKAEAIISTHFGAVKEYALENEGIINACMLFDEVTLKPTYKLVMGLPGNSNALSIAKDLGLNDYILKRAYGNISVRKREFDKILLQASVIREEAEKEKIIAEELKHNLQEERIKLAAERERLNKRLADLNENAKIEIRKLIRSKAEEADELLETIKEEVKKGENATLLDAKRAANKLWDLSYKADTESESPDLISLKAEDIVEGKRVYVKKTGLEGVITAIKKNEISVRVGAMIIKLKPDELAYPIENQKDNAKYFSNSSVIPMNNSLPKEIKVIGMTVAEAIEIIEPEIESMHAFPGNKILKIVHGKGTGLLARGIWDYLKKNKAVDSYRYGKYGEGDTGVTIVTVR